MRSFRWLGAEPIVRAADLRRRGWRLAPEGEAAANEPPSPILADGTALNAQAWRGLIGGELRLRGQVLMLGIADPVSRGELLRLGFGDVVGPGVALDEVDERAVRIAAHGDLVERWRRHGAVRLDIVAREAFLGPRRLALLPREFALLWRLMETPGQPVDRLALHHDVWLLAHAPPTNSLAVHASRLRAKLAAAGLPGFIHTTVGGAYLLPPLHDAAPELPVD